ncbi:MAG: hypothetical protein JO100_04740 [Pseudonocardia sp.]|nr:hypothetical protein [Pseudonocardia sp.]
MDSTPRQPDRAEAAALAAAFAADYLSWDETDQGHRGRVLARYLHMTASRDPALLGWSGKGRQRADFALPAAVRPDGPGRLVVDVRVRVTPYRRVGQTCPPAPAGELEVAGVPAVAPAPTASGWEGLGSQWILLAIPIIQVGSRLAVGAWGEQLRPGGQPNVAVGGAAADGELE